MTAYPAVTLLRDRAGSRGITLLDPIPDEIIDALGFPARVRCVDCGEVMRMPEAMVTEDGLVVCHVHAATGQATTVAA